MFWMNGMGPRGPMYGHIGYRRMNRRPMGLGILFLLPALMFGGWMILAVIGGVFGAVIMLLGSLLGGAISIFEGLGSVVSDIFSGLTSVGGIAIGVVIGLALYYYIRRRRSNATHEAEREEAQNDNAQDEYHTEYRRMGV